jgi:hypothetical protein
MKFPLKSSRLAIIRLLVDVDEVFVYWQRATLILPRIGVHGAI